MRYNVVVTLNSTYDTQDEQQLQLHKEKLAAIAERVAKYIAKEVESLCGVANVTAVARELNKYQSNMISRVSWN